MPPAQPPQSEPQCAQRPPLPHARRPPRPLAVGALAFAALASPLGPAALAQGVPPLAALGHEHEDLAAASLALERAESELERWLSASARVRPSLLYRDYLYDDRPASTSARLAVSIALHLGRGPTDMARALERVERARREVAALERRGVRDALLAHAELLVREAELEAARRAWEEAAEAAGVAREALAAAQGELPAGSTSPAGERGDSLLDGTPEEQAAVTVELDAWAARLGYEEALERRREARGEAARHGLGEAARYEPLRFALPAASPVEAPERRALELALALAEARLLEEEARPLDDLRVGLGYRLPEGNLGIEAGWINGRGGATLGLESPGGSERLELSLSAEIVLDDRRGVVRELLWEVEAARSELAAFDEGFAEAVERARERAERSESAVALAETILRRREGELLERELAWREARSAATGEEQRRLEAELLRAERSLVRAQGEADRSRLRLYRAWMDHVRRVWELLELVGGRWEAR